ncbi:alpha amanitin sensitivity protein [Brazilian porcupinepox virus 1]|nr:alpha amanitin sensitivity protein [Brazilian porcupinepox virus 1]
MATSTVIVCKFSDDIRINKIIKYCLKKMSFVDFKYFCYIFKKNVDFSNNDKDPSKKEIINILKEEFYYCRLKLFYDILSIIPTHKHICEYIETSLSDILSKSKYENKKINYIILDKIERYYSIDDICYMYFHWRKNKINNNNGKIFKELIKYDKVATDYYGYDIIDNYINLLNKIIDVKINIYIIDGDIIKYCKASIGIIAILSEKVKNDNIDLYDIFFKQVSIYYRLKFKKYLIDILK